ncbi:FxSxx-COOH system tetratricopeptide repeat protein [Microbispora sp. NPDC049125]|uniref:FxSxx-COOH system tetratricopeptide repeat protein n=1 Tax=Microbispora sp. NPDC049125 TaxID=3154929 RepID=UPI0034656EEE
MAGIFAFLTAAAGGYAVLTRRPALDSRPPDTDTRRIWGGVPPRNPSFTNRVRDLELIRTALTRRKHGTAIRSCAVHGLGGVGKSSLMCEYAHRYRHDYRLIWWVRAEHNASLAGDLARLLSAMSGQAEYDQADIFARLAQELHRWEPWLIMFDDARDAASLRESWPEVGTGDILVTSRSSNWEELTDEAVHVEVFSHDHAITLLRKRTADADDRSAAEVAERLGRLPLALVQAASYVSQTSTTLAHYAGLVESRMGAVLAATPPSDYNATIATTWSMSIDEAAARAKGARALLTFCSFMAPEAIPRNLPVECAEIFPEGELRDIATNRIDYDLAVAALNRYSLLTADAEFLSVHRLVQFTMRASLGEADQRAWGEAVIRTLNAAFPQSPGDKPTWGRCAELMPHVLAAADHARALGVDEPTGALLLRAGVYLAKRSFFTSSLEVLRLALLHLERATEADSLEVAETCGELARVQYRRADLADAILHCKRAVRIKEKRLGPAAPELADDLMRLGTVLMEMSRLDEADDALNRAMSLVEQSWGPTDRRLVRVLGRLSYLHQRQGRLQTALAYAYRQMDIENASVEADECAIAEIHHRLGGALAAMGDFSAAKEQHTAAYEVFLRLHGPASFDVLKTETALSDCCRELGDLKRATEWARDAVEELTALHGFDHPDKATALRSLGSALLARGRTGEAERLLRTSVAIYERFYEDDHPYVAEALAPLAQAQLGQGHADDAEGTLGRAESIVTERYGPEHPALAPVLRVLAALRRRQGRPAEADELETRADAIMVASRHS